MVARKSAVSGFSCGDAPRATLSRGRSSARTQVARASTRSDRAEHAVGERVALAAHVHGTHCTCAAATPLPFNPVEQDGRLLVQLETPSGGHWLGASTPSQLEQLPPFASQPVVNVQLP